MHKAYTNILIFCLFISTADAQNINKTILVDGVQRNYIIHLPENGIHLFKTKTFTQQGFVYNNYVAGLQFHFEIKDDLLKSMIEHERSELIKDDHVQTENEINISTSEHIFNQQKYMYKFLDVFSCL